VRGGHVHAELGQSGERVFVVLCWIILDGGEQAM